MRPRHVAVAALLLALGWLVLVPLGMILLGSFRTAPPGVASDLTLGNYRDVLGSATFTEATRNTLIYAMGSTAVAFAGGAYLAWVTERTALRLRPLVYALVLAPIVVPGVLTTTAWDLLLHERIGILNDLLVRLPLIDGPPLDGRSMLGMIWVRGTDGITLPFVLTAAALRSLDPAVEEASLLSGASRARTTWRITMPLLLPASLAGALIVFVNATDDFDVPAILGLPGGVRVLATEVYLATRQTPTNTNVAATYAVITLVLSLAGLWLYYRAVGRSERLATGGARSERPARARNDRWHALAAVLIVLTCVVLPLLVVLYASLLPYYSPPTRTAWDNLSLDAYRQVLFDNPTIERAVTNNAVAGTIAALAVMALGVLVSWIVARSRSRLRRVLDGLAFAPIAFPGLVLGLALVWLYLTLPVPVYATLAILVLAWMTAFLPFGVRISHAAMAAVPADLEEASATSGASWARTFVRVVLPLTAPGIVIGFVYVFTLTFRVLSLAVLLVGPGTEIVPVVVYDLQQSGEYSQLNALGALLVGFLLAMAVVGALVARRSRRRTGVDWIAPEAILQ